MSVEVKIEGFDLTKVQDSLRQAGLKAGREFIAAMYQEAQNLITAAKPITPIRFGALRNSGFVREPAISGNEVIIEAGFGGPSAPYAVYVHENLTAYHEPPTQAKFLEAAAAIWVQGLNERVAARVMSMLGML